MIAYKYFANVNEAELKGTFFVEEPAAAILDLFLQYKRPCDVGL